MRSTRLFAYQSSLAGVGFALLMSLTTRASAQTEPATQPPVAPGPAATTTDPPPTTNPTPAATAQTAPTNPPTTSCSPEAIVALHKDAPRFLVEVHARQGSAPTTGVVIEGNRVLVPYIGTLHGRWPITVFFDNGKESTATVQRVLKDRNLAVLTLKSPPADLAPRKFVQATPQVGAPVISVGTALRDGNRVAWEMRAATVSNAVGSWLAATPASNRAAPLLSCSGEIVGIELPPEGDFAPNPGALSAAAISSGLAGPKRDTATGSIGFGLLEPALVVALRPAEFGAGFKVGLVDMSYAPRITLRLNVGAQWLTIPERSEYANATDVFRWRLQFEAIAGFNHRFSLGSPAEGFVDIDLRPYIGVASRTDFTDLRRLGADSKISPTRLSEEHADPLVGLALELLKIRVSYQFQLDLKAPKQSIHTLGLGTHF